MSEAVESVRESLNAAFDAAERTAPPEPRPIRGESRTETSRNGENRVPNRAESDTDGPATHETSPESTELSSDSSEDRRESAVDRPRDQFGRFARSTPEAPKPVPGQQPAGAPDATGAELEIPDQPEPGAAEPARPAILPPQAWSAAARDSWAKLPRAIQEEVDRRERDVQRAFQQRAEQANVLEPLAQAISPYANKLALKGVNPAAAVQQLLAYQDLLESDPIAGIAHVARVYGVDLRQFATAFTQAQQPQDPAVRELAERVARQDQLLRQWQQGAEAQEQSRINDEVQSFAADTTRYPYFEHVRPRMAELMATGAAGTLAQAYRLACADDERISAAIRQNEAAAERAARSSQEREAAARARRAAVSVTGVPGGPAPEGRGSNATVRDAVRAALEQHNA